MKDIIFTILVTAAFSVWFAEVSTIPQQLSKTIHNWFMSFTYSTIKYKKGPRVKPFDCPMCLSWWLGLIIFTYQFYFQNHCTITASAIYTIAFAACTSVTAVFISKIIRP